MYCSYKPPMMAVAIHDRSASYRLMQDAAEFVLAVPGESLVEAAMFCGTVSLTEADKVEALGLQLVPSERISVPGLAQAIANIEMRRKELVESGDHVLVIGEVLRFAVNRHRKELPLVSFGPDDSGFRLLAKKGVHRLGVVRT
jgi:flavin reductase (DIM6/NTAB) family NADH-FMN oxidoreductase RutF